MTTHDVDGLYVRFTGRRTWRCDISANGQIVAEDAPVAWERDFRRDPLSNELLQAVSFRSREAMLEFNARTTPFIVGVITAKDYSATPLRFKQFVAVREVIATGRVLNDGDKEGDEPGYYQIETKVLRRLTGGDYEDAA